MFYFLISWGYLSFLLIMNILFPYGLGILFFLWNQGYFISLWIIHFYFFMDPRYFFCYLFFIVQKCFFMDLGVVSSWMSEFLLYKSEMSCFIIDKKCLNSWSILDTVFMNRGFIKDSRCFLYGKGMWYLFINQKWMLKDLRYLSSEIRNVLLLHGFDISQFLMNLLNVSESGVLFLWIIIKNCLCLLHLSK